MPRTRFPRALLLCLLAGPLTAADWPCWRGANHDGQSPETGLDWVGGVGTPRILWRAQVGRGSSAFAVVKKRAYTLGNENEEDVVRCLDAESGETRWTFRYPCALFPLSYEGGPSATPAVSAGKVYTLGKFGQAYCLDAADGKVLWTHRFAPPATNSNDYRAWWGFAGSPLVLDRQVIYPVGTFAAALDRDSGKLLWDNGEGRPGYSTPVPFMSRGEQIISFVSGHEVVAAKAAGGAPLWRLPWRTTWDMNASDVVPVGEKLFVSSGHGMGCALLDLSGGEPKELWRNKNLRTEYATAVRWKGSLYAFDIRKLACLDEASGEARWKSDDLDFGALTLADGKLVAQLEKGGLLVAEADPAGFKLVARGEVFTNRSWTVPTLSDGRLFLRSARGDVACVDVRPR